MKRENVVGRANVEDTPELEAYYRALEGEELGALWNVANEIEPWYPQPKSVPTLWKWKTVEPYVRKAAKLVSAEKAARRVVMRPEEHTSELQSQFHLVCRLLLEKKK